MTYYFQVGLAFIRARYRVPARHGGQIEYQGRFGHITGSGNGYVRVRFDGDRHFVIVHPTALNYVEADEVTDCVAPTWETVRHTLGARSPR
jgi:hypothetical protein